MSAPFCFLEIKSRHFKETDSTIFNGKIDQ